MQRLRGFLFFFAFLSLSTPLSAETILPVCFELQEENTILAIATRPGLLFTVIPPNGLDNSQPRFREHEVSVGATLVSRGAQFQEYLELTQVTRDAVTLRRYGHAKGLGEFNQEIQIPLSKKCKRN